MRYRKIFMIAILLVHGLAGINAQSTVTTSGGNATGSGGSVSYTVGQLFNKTLTGTGGYLAEGVQQPYEISTITGIDQGIGIILTGSVFPNPVSDLLTLRVELSGLPTLSYMLFDVNGRLVENKQLTNRETYINMSGFTSGTYFLKVIKDNTDLKTFKIIKN